MSDRPAILSLRDDCEFSRTLRGLGFRVLNLPMISTRRVADLTRFNELLRTPRSFDGIFITSSAAASVLAEELDRSGVKDLPTVYVLGKRSKEVLEARGIAVEYRETANSAGELLDQLGDSRFTGRSILFIRGDKSLRTIPERLGKIANVEEAIVYETVEVPADNDEAIESLRAGKIGWLCFFSPSAVESFAGRGFDIGGSRPKVAVIGETTAGKATSLGFEVDLISERASSVEFANGLARHINSFE